MLLVLEPLKFGHGASIITTAAEVRMAIAELNAGSFWALAAEFDRLKPIGDTSTATPGSST